VRAVLAFILALLLALTVACGGDGGDGDSDGDSDGGDVTLPTATIKLIGATGRRAELTVELARTSAERSRGLMFREELPEDRGMLFVFEGETNAGFWMKDTKIPLSIAFLTSDGLIQETQDMEPLSEALHVPAKPYYYALEVNPGWFERHGVAFGGWVEIPANAKAR
jgi:hypothetical protein